MKPTRACENDPHRDRSAQVPTQVANALTETASGSALLNHAAEVVWAEIRDFNSYPAYIDGVTESYLEDDKRGDEVGCVRRFVYNGDTIRQTLTGHSDLELWFTHAGCDPLDWPSEGEKVGAVEYTNLVQVKRVSDGRRACVEWSLEFKSTDASDIKHWKRYFEGCIPIWLASLKNYLELRAAAARGQSAAEVGQSY